jgi:hypothetical protein
MTYLTVSVQYFKEQYWLATIQPKRLWRSAQVFRLYVFL